MELDHATPGTRRAVRGQLLAVDGTGGARVEDPPAGVAHPLLEVDLLRVHEEVRIQIADLLGRPASHEHRAGLDPADLPRCAVPERVAALGDEPTVQEQGLGERRARAGKPPRAGDRVAVGVEELGPGDGRFGVGAQRLQQRCRGALEDLGVLVE